MYWAKRYEKCASEEERVAVARERDLDPEDLSKERSRLTHQTTAIQMSTH